jgi:hypothetical protein
MREGRTRDDRRVRGERPPSLAGRRVTILLGLVAAVLVGLVAYRYWPAWIGELGLDLLGQLFGRVERVWHETGGRWVTLLVVVAASAIGALLTRRNRTLGIAIVEVAIAAGAVVALLQPPGW